MEIGEEFTVESYHGYTVGQRLHDSHPRFDALEVVRIVPIPNPELEAVGYQYGNVTFRCVARSLIGQAIADAYKSRTIGFIKIVGDELIVHGLRSCPFICPLRKDDLSRPALLPVQVRAVPRLDSHGDLITPVPEDGWYETLAASEPNTFRNTFFEIKDRAVGFVRHMESGEAKRFRAEYGR